MNLKLIPAGLLALAALPALAVSTVAAPAGATATDAYLTTPFNLGVIDNLTIPISHSVVGLLFKDIYSFSVTNTTTISGGATFTGSGAMIVTLKSASNTLLGYDNTPSSFSFAPISAGSYTLNFVGVTSRNPGGSYSGDIMAQTVPEPQSYAMMLAGIGVIGFLAFRRRKD